MLGLIVSCGGAKRTDTLNQVAPDFTAKHVDGSTFQLSSLRGRVVVLDIWAIWCKGCEKELPVLDELAVRLASVDAVVVSVSIDEDPKPVLPLLRSRAWKMTALYDPSGAVGDAYQPNKMPAVYVIDREGTVRGVRFSLRPEDVAAIEAKARELAR